MKNGILLFLMAFLPIALSAQFPYALKGTTATFGAPDTVSGYPFPQGFPQWGTGVSCIDFNNDGLEDLTFATGTNQELYFYTNNGDGTFTKIAPLVSNTHHTKMVLWADYDNDGDKDLFVTAFQRPNTLYRNDGGGVFTDVTAMAGIPVRNDWTWGATWGDYNNDGLLDLYVCNRHNAVNSNYLYRNNGNGTFTDVTRKAGVSDGTQLTFQANFVDINNDGWLDLYLANDRLYGNTLFRNNGDGTFTDISTSSAAGITIDAMNTAAGDFNNDGFFDLYVTNTPNGGNVLLRNNGDETFSDISASAGVQGFNFFWAGNFFDIENDGDEDLYVSCMKDFTGSQNKVYVNQFVETGMEVFTEPYVNGLPGDTAQSYANAIFDFNDDGKLDIIVPNNGSDTIHLWENIVSNSNNWVKFTVEGTVSNRDGYGTRVEIWAGGKHYVRGHYCGDAYLNQNSEKIHFGIGTASMVDSVAIHWLSGITDVLTDLSPNQTYNVVENSTNPIPVNVNVVHADCHGSDGEATATPGGGVGPYTYEWTSGDMTATATSLAEGNYLVTVTDSNGDRGIGFASINNIGVITCDIAVTMSTNGVGGAADLTVTGGKAPFTYSWSNSATTEDISGLAPGAYEVVVVDDNLCEGRGIVGIYDNVAPCMPIIPTETVVTAYTATLKWDVPPTADASRARYREVGSPTWLISPAARDTDSELTIEGLTPDTEYEYQTKTRCDGPVISGFSASYFFRTAQLSGLPCDSWIPHTIASDHDSAVIEWTDNQDADRYRIRYRIIGDPIWKEQVALWAMVTLGNLTPSSMYEFQSATLCGATWTEWSVTTWNFTTTMAPPAMAQAGGPAETDREDRSALEQLEESAEASFKLFPNPARESITIEFAGGDNNAVTVRNANGQVIRLINSTLGSYSLDLSELPTGMYFVTVVDANGMPSTQRFIKN